MNKVIIFVLGATAGSLITWKFLEKKYKDIADDEIEAVREYYKSKDKVIEEINRVDQITYRTDNVQNETDYNKVVNSLGYVGEDDVVVVDQGEESIAPYVISPDEFGEAQGYETKSWTYYSDFVLADENDEIVVDIESTIGDGLEHFGEYEDDSVYIRNDNYECDYEILKHEKTFSEINEKYNSRDDY